jgi:hypothetical protein
MEHFPQTSDPTYSQEECLNKGLKVYSFVYEHHHDAKTSVFEKALT